MERGSGNRTNQSFFVSSDYGFADHGEEPVLIDISQGAKLAHPNSIRMLRRDITHLNRWFKSLGVKTRDVDEVMEWLK